MGIMKIDGLMIRHVGIQIHHLSTFRRHFFGPFDEGQLFFFSGLPAHLPIYPVFQAAIPVAPCAFVMSV